MGARVLVVDDDSSSCQFMKDVLAHATGMDVLALIDSKVAFEHLAKEKFGIILLDMLMPSPDGLDLTRQAQVRRQPNDAHHHGQR